MAHLALHPGENIIDVYHQSEMVLTKTVLLVLVALYIPWFFAIKYGMITNLRGWLFLWTLLVACWALRAYFIWSLNQYIITSQRLIRMAHEGTFKRVVIETPLERILNVSYKTTGLASALFGYGDVEVQVVGLMEPIILKNIKAPREIKDYLWQLHQQRASETKHPHYTNEHIAHLQEEAGYTKKNQKVL